MFIIIHLLKILLTQQIIYIFIHRRNFIMKTHENFHRDIK
jgi:hypothetical protein